MARSVFRCAEACKHVIKAEMINFFTVHAAAGQLVCEASRGPTDDPKMEGVRLSLEQGIASESWQSSTLSPSLPPR